MNELEVKRTPEMIGAEIRMYVDVGRRITLLCGIEIGRRLVEAKEMLGHGEWLPWLEKETEFSERSAQRYMKVFDEYGASQLGLFGPETKATTLSDLPISKALALLSVPESERESFAEEVDAEQISVRDLEQAIRAKEEAEQKLKAEEVRNRTLHESVTALTDKSEKSRRELEEKLRAAKDELKALKEAPITMVEPDAAAIEEAVQKAKQEAAKDIERDVLAAKKEARKEAEATLQKTIDDLTAALKKSEAEKQKAETALGEAQKKAEAAGDSEELRGEIESLKKQLTIAAPEVAEFKAAFNRAQAELGAMEKALNAIGDETVKGKLRKAAAALLEGAAARVKA